MTFKKIILILPFFILLSIYCGKSGEDMPSLRGVDINTIHVAGHIYMLEATGDVAGNIAVSAGPDGILLVDTQWAPLADKIREALRKISSKEIQYIINTHHHTDHTHGNRILGESATIISHINAKKRLADSPQPSRPDITFEEKMSLYFNGEKINLIHFPHGHTDNDLVVFFRESNVIHLGDLWNYGIASFPTVDLSSGGSVTGMLKNISRLIELIPEDTPIIPGHYGLADLESLKFTQDMLVETITLVGQKMTSGKTLADIKKEGFPSTYKDWGTAYTDAETWMENIYQGLQQEIPETVTAMHTYSNKIYLNQQGYWETELPSGHVLAYIPAGEFPMGSSKGLANERPVHQVYLDGYWMSKYPITVGQFRDFIEATGYITDAEKGMGSWQYWKGEWVPRKDGNWQNTYFEQGKNHPVVSISWNDAAAYCEWLSKKTGLEFQIPTEAQWEKGARGTDKRTYPWGYHIPDGSRANYADINFWNKYNNVRPADKTVNDGYTETSPVGSYPDGASPFGIMDIAGNVWEWCRDVYADDYYRLSPYKNPLGPQPSKDPAQARVNRGGSWTDRSGHITPKGGHNLRSAARTGDEQNSSDDHMGFRICIESIK